MATVPLSAAPAAGQRVEHEGKHYDTIREGDAYILIPPNTQKHVDPQNKLKEGEKAQNVFYNPIQQFNRDLSVLAIKAFSDDYMERKRRKQEKNKERHNNKKTKKRKKDQDSVEGAEVKPADAQPTLIANDAEKDGENAIAELMDSNSKKRKAEDLAEGNPKRQKSAEGNESAESSNGVAVPQATSATKDSRASDSDDVDFILNKSEATGPVVQTNGSGPHKDSEPRFRILDALSATGLRALRYAHEIPCVSNVVANDMNPNATKSMTLNIEHNNLTSKITPNTGDAIGHMYTVAFPPAGSHGPHHISKKYDVIDLDPYGTAAPFLDAALQAINDGGLLCVTCTDSGVFASTGYCEKTFALYGGMPVKHGYNHEGGLRLILNSIASAAARYGLAIEPLLSLSIDFYARVFVRVRKSPADVKFLAGKTMIVYCCDAGCGAWTTNFIGRNTKQTAKNGVDWYKHTIAQSPNADALCEHCGSKTHIAGPMWGGPIHNAAFIEKLLDDLEDADPKVYQTKPRVEGMISTALDELLVNDAADQPRYVSPKQRKETDDIMPKVPPEARDLHPFYFNPSAISKVIHCVAPSRAAMNGAIRHAGYRATLSHCQPGSIKTDAPWKAIWEIMREWVRQKQPAKELKENTPGKKIMADESRHMKVVFDEVLGKDKPGKRLVRYQQNPRENWGPMTKAKGSA